MDFFDWENPGTFRDYQYVRVRVVGARTDIPYFGYDVLVPFLYAKFSIVMESGMCRNDAFSNADVSVQCEDKMREEAK